jgi:hypothetical protein
LRQGGSEGKKETARTRKWCKRSRVSLSLGVKGNKEEEEKNEKEVTQS